MTDVIEIEFRYPPVTRVETVTVPASAEAEARHLLQLFDSCRDANKLDGYVARCRALEAAATAAPPSSVEFETNPEPEPVKPAKKKAKKPSKRKAKKPAKKKAAKKKAKKRPGKKKR